MSRSCEVANDPAAILFARNPSRTHLSTSPCFDELLAALARQHDLEVEKVRDDARASVNCDMKLAAPDISTPLPPFTPNQVLEEDSDESPPASPSLKPTLTRSNTAGFEAASRLSHLAWEHALTDSRKSFSESSYTQQKTSALREFLISTWFDQVSAVVLTMNALFIGLQVQYEFENETPTVVIIIDYIFCVLFLAELIARLWALGCHTYWVGADDRAWNHFDFVVVTLTTVDAVVSIAVQGQSVLGNISALRTVRLIRVTRVLRIIRVMKVFKDLRLLIAAIASTVKTAFYAFVLIFCAMWMFSIALTQLVAGHVKETRLAGGVQDPDLLFYFGSLWKSMLTLFMTISGGIDWKDALEPLLEVDALGVVFYVAYILMMVLCVMNVLTGIFCQAAVETAQTDRDKVIQSQLLEKQRYIETLKTLFDQFDDSRDGKCSFEEFKKHIQNPNMQALLRSLDIEVRDAMTIFELFDSDGSGEIDLDEFVTACITLRGGAKAVHMEKVSAQYKHLAHKLHDMENKLGRTMREPSTPKKHRERLTGA
eukprot:TRINITY_DN11027_c0_g1_i9.p1 TRINITY_DN11027_c0_g1~~TRINITY_DN11027_c0_g1_i9.p1  ORF type:complete len:541 (-),score=91.31 TRINITY_DN11027_c0_g1_i9:65-1687(-)